MTTHLLSQHAFDRLQAELEDLTTRGRIEVAEKIERARELGDLSENGDYHAAKDEQGHMEGRIRQLENLIANAEIVAPPVDGVVGPGSIVTVSTKVTTSRPPSATSSGTSRRSARRPRVGEPGVAARPGVDRRTQRRVGHL